MNFLIADTFTGSLARLTREEQKAVKTTAFDLQINPANPGMSFHRLEKARDKNFWSVRVNADIRLIVHKTAGSFLLCYVDHHDKAYAWAERRKLETHPKTGAAQLVEIRETVHEVLVPVYVAAKRPAVVKPSLFAEWEDAALLSHGVPAEWLKDVKLANEDTLLALTDHLPAEAAEALLELATGGKPRPVPPPVSGNPFDHPDARRRFRVMGNVEELQQALEFPWDKWTIFLHPDQRQFVERGYNGPARIAGSAGTGKTIVALHRAVYLAKQNPEGRVLLTTFSGTLANALRWRLKRLLSPEPRLGERVEVHSLEEVGLRLHRGMGGKGKLATREVVVESLRKASTETAGHRFTLSFLLSEWNQVVDAWQLKSWEEYRDVARLGRKTRLPEAQRATLWSIFEKVTASLAAAEVMTAAAMFTAVARGLAKMKHPPFDFAVVDEAQDIGVAHLRFFAALGRGRADALFFAGDLGQRIFQQPFSWLALGVDIRGRSRTLRVNYRTSHQIRTQADRLLDPEVTDVDGNAEARNHTISVFNGPPPDIRVFKTTSEEATAVATWLTDRLKEGLAPHELGIFVRSGKELARARAAAEKGGLPFVQLDDLVEVTTGSAALCAMHLAKGLEFRAVAVMACDDEILPSQERMESVGDDADLQEVFDTERHLLYVACTRARDHLLITAVSPASEFLDDMK